jgi:hypothetical protein
MSLKPLAATLAFASVLAAPCCRPAPDAPLIVYLRCHEGAMGSLSIISASGSGESAREYRFDVKGACAAGKVELQGYRSSQTLRFRLGRTDGEAGELTSRYGTNIQRDQNSYFVVVKIMDTPPFLANDSI